MLLLKHQTQTIGSLGNRRQRSLRERAKIDGRLDRLVGPGANAASSSGGTTGGRLGVAPTVLPLANHDCSRPVRVRDFVEHVRLMAADSDFRFSEEFDVRLY